MLARPRSARMAWCRARFSPAESGLAFLQGLIDGVHPPPPFSRATGIYLTSVAEGRAVFTGVPSEAFLNPIGTIHGGWTSALLDSAMACAVHTTLQARPGLHDGRDEDQFRAPDPALLGRR